MFKYKLRSYFLLVSLILPGLLFASIVRGNNQNVAQMGMTLAASALPDPSVQTTTVPSTRAPSTTNTPSTPPRVDSMQGRPNYMRNIRGYRYNPETIMHEKKTSHGIPSTTIHIQPK